MRARTALRAVVAISVAAERLPLLGGLASWLDGRSGTAVKGFEPAATPGVFADVTAGGAVSADYHNDGWLDLSVTSFGRDTLFHDDAGAGITGVTERAGIGDAGYGTTYHNDGDGTFPDATAAPRGTAAHGWGFVAGWLDHDDALWIVRSDRPHRRADRATPPVDDPTAVGAVP